MVYFALIAVAVYLFFKAFYDGPTPPLKRIEPWERERDSKGRFLKRAKP